ncbi:Fic/DOC family N-terminal domain-containing protein [Pontiellaceae bacterium B1224]|nr:Fic/DOC family N-terminal domain-containing protein [Pontiellaceae bacterium B1224]
MSAVKYHSGKFPPKTLEWEKLIPLVGPANAAVARYDGVLTAVPNASVLLSPLTTQEAVLSSKIEGTQATMGEVLEFEAEGGRKKVPDEKREDIQEVLNYRKAMRHAEKMMDKLPLCQRVIKETHAVLLDGVRGHGKAPGEYRRIPNWIGPHGCPVEEARFIPISAGDLDEGMGRWDKYINGEAPDRLIQLAILHAEMEALHPFLDGNGRLGRMCIPLFMHQVQLIHRPMFYISAYFEANRDEYYERLLAVSRDGDWSGWCAFFLKAIQQQAELNLEKANSILELYNRMKLKMVEISHSQFSIHALDWIFEQPIFNGSDFIRASGIPKATATRILRILKEENIIQVWQEARGSKPAVYGYEELLNAAEGYKAFK